MIVLLEYMKLERWCSLLTPFHMEAVPIYMEPGSEMAVQVARKNISTELYSIMNTNYKLAILATTAPSSVLW